MKVLAQVAKVNKRALPKDVEDIYDEKHTLKDIIPIFKHPRLMARWLAVMFIW